MHRILELLLLSAFGVSAQPICLLRLPQLQAPGGRLDPLFISVIANPQVQKLAENRHPRNICLLLNE